jgi:glycoprotein-N-acetylgalactosamine 3-beta-galactosyltransferase
MSKAIHIQATWGHRCNKLLFVTEKDDTGALAAVRVDVETGREHLTAKTMNAFQHVYEHHLDDADWFMKVY